MASEIPDPQRDRELGMDRPITRRDFLDGVAVAAGAAGLLAGNASAATAFPQDRPGYDPPVLTGMRGSHEGSYTYAHALRDGKVFDHAAAPIDTQETYDLVVVGGGISGLAAAYFFRARTHPSAKILILDNHDDFGGHAKRNEFRPGGRLFLCNGGTLSIESPFDYSKEARGLLTELGIDPVTLEAKSEMITDRTALHGLQNAFFFDKETFGTERLVVGMPGGQRDTAAGPAWKDFLARTPLSEKAQADIARLQQAHIDYMPGLSDEEKKDKLSRISYKDFLLNYVKVDPTVIPFYQTRTHGLYGVGIDAVGALELWGYFPGFQGMNLKPGPFHRLSFTALGQHIPKKPYEYHFPDGNATIARLLVRSLIPGTMPGHTAEDSILENVDYSALDHGDSPVRIRLGSTCLRARHAGNPTEAKEVEIVCGREKQMYSVRAKSVILACWNMMIPYLCPDLPAKQREALHYGVKVPLVYTNVALRNWTAFKKLGMRGAQTPGMYHSNMNLEQPTDIAGYRPSLAPEEPILLRMLRTPCKPGLSARDQQRAGHVDLLMTPFSTFERNIRDQLARVLGGGGFDPARDIDAITVNRWPHGYAYEYNFLWDPEWPKGQSPCEIGRKRFGRISIANSDAAAAAYTDQAINQAYRAVHEQLELGA
ncbi:MAG TPA: NAD(P)-binding protein [Bryobacteraceae bacterium]|nr:NAD(P)-binding protein [Bryobacteraceae bacterium]